MSSSLTSSSDVAGVWVQERGSRASCLVVVGGAQLGNQFDLDEVERLTIGRGRDCDVRIKDGAVSRKHAEIIVREGVVVLRDLSSTNGTYVDERRVESLRLEHGQYIEIGPMRLKYVDGRAHEAARQRERIRQTQHDPLTGVYNRRAFGEQLEYALARARRYDRPLALVLFDIDHFARFNDTHGVRAGDSVLSVLAALIRRRAGRRGVVARSAGSQFAVVLWDRSPDEAARFAENLRATVEHETQRLRLTLCAGVVDLRPRHERAEQLLEAAEQCVARAKTEGRNRVVMAADS